jgi:DNA-binding transcriptional LysR family regulator
MPLLRHLRYFVAVAEERHFGRAAQRLMIAQPGLSQQIKSLERFVGVPLLIRDKRTVELTPAGEALLDEARLVIELADRAIETTRVVGDGKSGLLKIGTRALGIHGLADALLREFDARFPHVSVEFHPALLPQSIGDLERHKVDVAMILAPFETPEGANYVKLGSVEPLVALPLGHALADLERIPRSRLLSETFLDWPRSFNPSLLELVHARTFGEGPPRRIIEVADLSETSRLVRVAAGEGITVTVSPALAELEMANIVFRRIEDPAPDLEYGIAWFDNAASKFVHPFVEVAREIAAAARSGRGVQLLTPEPSTAGPPPRSNSM